MKETVIIVTVYKNRYSKLIDWLASEKSTISDTCDIVLLAQNNDEYKEYEKYCKKENMRVVWCDATNIGEKRKYGYHWAIDNGYKNLIWTDDDLYPTGTAIDFITKNPSGKYKGHRIPVDEIYDRLIKVVEDHPDAGMVTCFRSGFLGMSTTRIYKNKALHPNALILINLNVMKHSDIEYNTSPDWMEDQCFYLDMLVSGYPIYCEGSICPNYPIYRWNHNNKSLVYSDSNGGLSKRDMQQIRQYVKYGGDLYIGRSGNLTTKINYSKYYGAKDLPIPYGKSFDEDLMRLCKSREDETLLKEVIDYLTNKKTKKR